MNLYEFQKEAISKFFKVSKCRMIAALPTGTGKTVVALAIINKVLVRNSSYKILVIVPANLRNNFVENIRRLKLKLNAKIVTSKNELEIAYKQFDIVIISFNFLRLYFDTVNKYKWNMLVVDEIHYAKNMNTKNFKLLWKLTGQVNCFLGLTASYVSNRLEEFFSIIALVANQRQIIYIGKQLIQYETRGQYKPSYISKLLLGDEEQKGKLVQVGISDPHTFKLLVSKYIYLPKNEKVLVVGKRPVPKSIKRLVNLTEFEWKTYKYVQGKIPKTLIRLLSSGDINEEQLRQIKNQIMAMQQVLITPDYIIEGKQSKRPSSKVLACANHILNNKSKALVFTPFLEHGAKIVYEYFRSKGIKCALYAGNINKHERQMIQKDFESGKIDVIVLTAAGKEGINLPSATEVHFLSLTWNPEDLEQVMGRALRMTSTNETVYVYWYFAVGPDGEETIDIWMDRVLDRKRILKQEIYKLLSEFNSVANLSSYETLDKKGDINYATPNKRKIRKRL